VAVEIHVQQQRVQIARAAAAAAASDPALADVQPVSLLVIVIHVADIGGLPHLAARGHFQMQRVAISGSGKQG
jgi:hypothetical protein